MKNTVITLAAAFALGLASCGGGSNSNTLTQEQLDSAKAAFDDSVRLVEQAKMDSIAKVQAQIAADSTQASIDSLTKAANKKVTTVTQKQTKKPTTNNTSSNVENTAPAVVDAPAKDEKSTSNRPGAKNQSSTQSSSANSENVKSTSNRPGAK